MSIHSARPEGRRKVLFASSVTQWPISAMLKAEAFANYLNADLFVFQVSKVGRRRRGLFRRESAREVIKALEQWMTDRTKALERCNYILPGEISTERLLIRQGEFVREVVQAARELEADLVVMPPQKQASGLPAVDIALAAKVPVLIARPPRSHNIIVAATNLADGRYPVIHQAGQVGGYLGAQLVLVHNIAPLAISGGLESGVPIFFGFDSHRSARSQARLHQVAQKFPNCTATLVKTQMNTAQAILETARKYDADLIVVGATHEPSRIERLLGGSVAARVAEKALRSVLLTPLSIRPAEVSVGPGAS